jgi:hypothetical protein
VWAIDERLGHRSVLSLRMYCGKTDVSGACGDGRSALAETKVRPVAAIHYRNRSDPDIRLGSLWEGWQWRAADRDCESGADIIEEARAD